MEIFISPFKQQKSFILHQINYVESPHDSFRSQQNLLPSFTSWCKRNINWKKKSSLYITQWEIDSLISLYNLHNHIIVESWIMSRIMEEKMPTLSYYAFCSASAYFSCEMFSFFPSTTGERKENRQQGFALCYKLSVVSSQSGFVQIFWKITAVSCRQREIIIIMMKNSTASG